MLHGESMDDAVEEQASGRPVASGTGHRVAKIVSGGQTGVDRAGLDAGFDLGLEVGGWCPLGRVAEDGVIPDRYDALVECDVEGYAERTQRNVEDSDATLVFYRRRLEGGSRFTAEHARRIGKPVLTIDVQRASEESLVDRVRAFADEHAVAVLNVAGPRASKAPGLGTVARRILAQAFSDRSAAPS